MNLLKKSCAMLALALMMAMPIMLTACGSDAPVATKPNVGDLTAPVPTLTTQMDFEETSQTAFLGDNLYITEIGDYSGSYMEDGSNEMVSNVLMMILKNEGTKDLQFARINLVYADFTANFEVSNLPAGESVVLLEKNRHAFVSDSYLQARADNLVFFPEPMNLKENQVKITGGKGQITVENIGDKTLGKIYVYYKNSATDLFYGGITYRASLEEGLQPGKTMTVPTNHYYEGACTILHVDILELSE